MTRSPRSVDPELGQLSPRSTNTRDKLKLALLVFSFVTILVVCVTLIVILPPRSLRAGRLRQRPEGCPDQPPSPLPDRQVREMKSFVRFGWPRQYDVEYRCKWLVKKKQSLFKRSERVADPGR